MKRRPPILIVALAATAFIAVAAHGLIEYYATRDIIDQFAETQQDSDTMAALDQVLDDGANRQSPQQTGAHLRILDRLTRSEPAQQKRLHLLQGLLSDRFHEPAGSERSRQIMRAIRRDVDDMRATEEQERSTARISANASGERVLRGIGISTTVAAMLLLLTFHQFAVAVRANRLKDRFLAIVSHELRTPLTAILGWSALLQENDVDPPLLAEGLTAIQRSASVQKQLIDDLLDVARIQSGKLRLSMRALDLTDTVRAVVDSMRPAAEAKSISIVTTLDRSICISGDPDRLQQIVWNLLTNAVKFTPRGGQIAAGVSCIGSHAVIEIRDSGEGIDASFLPHVFEPFRQSDSSRARVHKGLGLGLSIVRHLVEAHGGTISVESPGKDQGTTFRIVLSSCHVPMARTVTAA